MNGRYTPSKTQVTLAEMRTLLAEYKKSLNEANKALDESSNALKLARKLLVVKEVENRKLKLIILRMTEGDGKDDVDSR